MPALYSNDFRQKVDDSHTDQEGGYRTLAKRFRVSRDFVRELIQHHPLTNDVTPNPRQHEPRPKFDGDQLQAFAQHTDATLNELVELVRLEYQINIGKSSVDRALKRLGITLKKTLHNRANFTETTERQRDGGLQKPPSLTRITLAGARGFEPRLTDPKTVVLPLDDAPARAVIEDNGQ